MNNEIAIKALLSTINEVENRRLAAINAASLPYDNEIAELKNAISLLRGSKYENKQPHKKKRGRPFKQPPISDTYPSSESVLEKFVFILKEADRFLNISEIAQRVKGYEPQLEIEEIKKQFGKHVNVYRDKKKAIVTEKIEGGKYIYYGLPEFIKDGKILEKHINILM